MRHGWRCRPEDTADRGVQGAALGGTERPGGRLRVQTGQEEGFVGVDVADPGDEALVEQHGLDGGATTTQPAPEGVAVEGGIDGVGAELGERLGGVIHQVERAELADVDEAQLAAVVEGQAGAEEVVGGRGGGAVAQGAGHPQVDDQERALAEADEQVLAVPADVRDRRAA